MTNKELSSTFERLAELLELAGENSFKTKTYSIAAFRIGQQQKPVIDMTASELKKIENIGPAVISKIEELQRTGSIGQLEELLQVTPPGIVDMLGLKGLGAKKVRQLWLELEIESLGELLYACQENRLAGIKGFGAKTQDNIRKNIEFIFAHKDFFLYQTVDVALQELEASLQQYFADNHISIVGDYARQENIITRIEWLTDIPKASFIEALEAIDFTMVEDKDNTLIVSNAVFPKMFVQCCTTEEWQQVLFEQNSTQEFIDLFSSATEVTHPSEHSYQEEKYKLPYLIPAKRHEQNWDKYKAGQLKHIEESSIKGLIHCHSTYSDGVHSIEEMAQACMSRGYEYMVLTDHSQAAFYANGLSRERILIQHEEIDRLNLQYPSFRIFKGIEADILFNGDIDYDEAVWQSMEVIIASVHANLRMTMDKATERILTALDNPFVRILGHPTGRLLLSRDGYPIDHKTIIDTCIDKGIVIELNAHPRRLDIDWRWINYIIDNGGMISINPDAHSVEGIDMIRYGIKSAQKASVSAASNLSSYSLSQIEEWIQRK